MVLTLGSGPLIFAGVDTNPEVPTSVTAAVIAFAILAGGGLIVVIRVLWSNLNAERAGRAADAAAFHAEIGRLQNERLRDAQGALAGFGTRLYDAAQFIERGTSVVAEAASADVTRDELAALRADVRALVDRAGRSLAGDSGSARPDRPGVGGGVGDGRGGGSAEEEP